MCRCGVRPCNKRAQLGGAIAETLVALIALLPFVIGLPLVGKLADIKHKAVDAARYAVWERTVWQSSGERRKHDTDITIEIRDRILGDPRAPLLAVDELHAHGITNNPLWRDHRGRRLLESGGIEQTSDERGSSIQVGSLLVPRLAHGEIPTSALLRVRNLNLNPRGFVHTRFELVTRNALAERASRSRSLGNEQAEMSTPSPLRFEARGAILSDTWAAAAEEELRRRVDFATANELIESLERPARVLGALAAGRGRALYGEGQYARELELRPYTADVPRAYIRRHRAP